MSIKSLLENPVSETLITSLVETRSRKEAIQNISGDKTNAKWGASLLEKLVGDVPVSGSLGCSCC